MASLNMTNEELKQLELLRNRFAQLTSSLASLRASVLNSNPLPSRESLQASAGILQQNIRSLVELASENGGLLQRVVVHPSTNFPGRTQEHVLLQLIRKKLEPDVEGWAEEARATAAAAGVDPSKLAAGSVPARGGGGIADDYDDEDDYGMGHEEDEDEATDPFTEQWADMQDVFQETLRQYVAVQVAKKYTVEEQEMGVEKVRTGLRQSLEDSDEEEEDEDEEEEEDEDENAAVPAGSGVGAGAAGAAGITNGQPVPRPEHVLWLATRGNLNLPRNIIFTSQQR